MPFTCSTDILDESLQILSSWLSLACGRLSMGAAKRPVRPEWLSWLSACSSFSAAAPQHDSKRISNQYDDCCKYRDADILTMFAQ